MIFLNIFLILTLWVSCFPVFAASLPNNTADSAVEKSIDPSPVQALKPLMAPTSEQSTATPSSDLISVKPIPVFENSVILQSLKSQPILFELFTSLDCLFCPKAEKILTDMADQTRAIFIACHTDPETSSYPLSREFCTMRQEKYSAALSDGLMYTPQLILNGHVDVVGHDKNDVIMGLDQTLKDRVISLTLRPSSQPSIFVIDVPAIDLGPNDSADLFMITYRPPVTLSKTMRQAALRPDPLMHIANRFIPLGGINGKPKTVTASFHPGPDDAGFIVFIQRNDHKILAVGEYTVSK